MKKILSTKTLIIVIVILAGIVIVNKMFLSKRSERNFKETLVTIDTTNVSYISFVPKQSTEETVLIKKNNMWFVKIGDKEYNASSRNITGLLSELNNLKPKSIAGRKKEKWEKFEVNDSLGVKLKVKEGDNIVADLIVGKFSYKQGNGSQGQQNYIITSYVRLASDEDVYAVDGQLSLMFNEDPSSYRNTTIAQFKKEDVTEISANYQGNSIMISKQNNVWMQNGLQADSTSIDSYLSSLQNLTNRTFVNDNLELTNPLYTFKFVGNNFQPIEIQAFGKDSVSSYITSSQNVGTVFEDTNNQVVNKLMKINN